MADPRRTPGSGPRTGRTLRSPGTSSPRNARPGRRGGAGRTPKTAEVVERPRFTNRAAVLLVVLAILVVSYASSMRAYLQQRDHINALKAEIASSKADIAAAEREKRRWHDPAYIEQQAKERFGWVEPGATAYQVLDQDGKPLTPDSELTDPSSVAPPPPTAWWSKVQASMDAADHPEKLVRPTPATRIKPDSDPAEQ